MAKRKQKPRGLGDTIEQITEATGIKSAVKLFSEITGIDCGCDDRKEKLNELFPYRNINCLNEADYNYLKNFFETNPNQLDGKMQREITAIYLNVFNVTIQPSNCPSCWMDYIGQLRRVYNEY